MLRFSTSLIFHGLGMYVCMHVCMYVHAYVHTYVCMYVCNYRYWKVVVVVVLLQFNCIIYSYTIVKITVNVDDYFSSVPCIGLLSSTLAGQSHRLSTSMKQSTSWGAVLEDSAVSC